jgi:AraC-like DNA-binding protein
MDAERERRIGLNESVFREVNERIEDAASSFGLTDQLSFVCECGDRDCVQQISMTRAEYEALRTEATHFAVFPGHEIADVEEIVERRKGYDVIRKREGQPAKVARETDPKS